MEDPAAREPPSPVEEETEVDVSVGVGPVLVVLRPELLPESDLLSAISSMLCGTVMVGPVNEVRVTLRVSIVER